MKTTTIFLFLISLFAYSQNDAISTVLTDTIQNPKNYDRFIVSVNTEPYAWHKDGFNMGIDIQHYNRVLYIGAGAYLFPDLNNIDYTQFHSKFGLNVTTQNRRAYTGVLAGFTMRDGGPFTVLGFESGFEYYFTEKFGLGLEGSYLNRSDLKFYDTDPWIFNGSFKLIYRFK